MARLGTEAKIHLCSKVTQVIIKQYYFTDLSHQNMTQTLHKLRAVLNLTSVES